MGLQRMQPDMSYWHMWIYASMLILCNSNNKVLSAKHRIAL
jgi:hypothetical protein